MFRKLFSCFDMTLLLNKLSNKLFPFRRIFYLLTVCLAVFIIYNLVTPTTDLQNDTLIIWLIAFIWLLLFNVMLQVFKKPDIATPTTWLQKLKFKMAGIVQKLLLIIFSALTIIIIYLTFKLLNL